MPVGRRELEALNDPSRFSETAELHANAFNWRPQRRIPLGIHVVNPEHAKGMDYRDWLTPEPFLEFQTKVLTDTLCVGSDVLPAVAINHLGHAVLTSMFGSELFMPDKGSATLQNVGPTPIPLFSSIEETSTVQVPDLDCGILPDVRRMVRYYRERLPGWVSIAGPMPAGPFSTAMQLRGSDILADMVYHPGLCRRLIQMCASLQANVELHLHRLAEMPPDQHITNFGIMGAGVRLGEDSMVTLSPRMIEEFCAPAFHTINSLCGGRGHIHFCSLPHSRSEHIYTALADSFEVAVISSQFGFEYYQEHLDALRGRLAIESFYGDAYKYVCEKYGSFRDWAKDFVPRFKNESGLVLYCQTESVEEAREIWAAWEEAHKV